MKAKYGRWFHLSLAAFWFVQMLGCGVIMEWDWKLYLLEISLAANFATHLAGYSAERPTEVAK